MSGRKRLLFSTVAVLAMIVSFRAIFPSNGKRLARAIGVGSVSGKSDEALTKIATKKFPLGSSYAEIVEALKSTGAYDDPRNYIVDRASEQEPNRFFLIVRFSGGELTPTLVVTEYTLLFTFDAESRLLVETRVTRSLLGM